MNLFIPSLTALASTKQQGRKNINCTAK